jgi:hypothetical protein
LSLRTVLMVLRLTSFKNGLKSAKFGNRDLAKVWGKLLRQGQEWTRIVHWAHPEAKQP